MDKQELFLPSDANNDKEKPRQSSLVDINEQQLCQPTNTNTDELKPSPTPNQTISPLLSQTSEIGDASEYRISGIDSPPAGGRGSDK